MEENKELYIATCLGEDLQPIWTKEGIFFDLCTYRMPMIGDLVQIGDDAYEIVKFAYENEDISMSVSRPVLRPYKYGEQKSAADNMADLARLIDALRQEAVAGKTVFVAFGECDEMLGIFTDKMSAYHCVDCNCGGYVEEGKVLAAYKPTYKERVYSATFADDQEYDDWERDIRTNYQMDGFEEKDVTNAIMFYEDDGHLHLRAKLTTFHRVIFVDLARKIFRQYDEKKPKLGQWYSWPAMRELHLRKLSDFERSIFENISVGIPENGKFYDGTMSQLEKLEESNE